MTNLDFTAARDTLQANLAKLSANDRDFAASLLKSRFPSDKQAYWIEQLAKRATTPAPVAQQIGDLSRVLEMFRIAATHKKTPAIVLRCEGVGTLRLSVAGPNAKVPGSITVVDHDTRVWYGRVTVDGAFEASRRDTPPAGVAVALGRFAADPLVVAAEHGRLTTRCCFCNQRLSNPASVRAGYGPICADHHGLAHG